MPATNGKVISQEVQAWERLIGKRCTILLSGGHIIDALIVELYPGHGVLAAPTTGVAISRDGKEKKYILRPNIPAIILLRHIVSVQVTPAEVENVTKEA